MSKGLGQSQSTHALDRKHVLLLAIICALTVSNLYLVQPLLAEIAEAFQVSAASVGIVATLSQVGYGIGVLLIVPLGDLFERRMLILTLMTLVTSMLVFAGFSSSLPLLSIANLLIGITTVVPQIVIPYAASLAPPRQQASVVGTVQSGLLIGILLARTVSGGIASALSWRGAYFVAAAISVLISVVIWFRFPKQEVAQKLSYPTLLRSMGSLLASHSVLRRVSIAAAFNFAAFSVFWTTLAFLLDSSFHYGPGVVGLFGIIGVVGAAASSVAGRMTDRRGARFTQYLSFIVTLISFVIFCFGEHSLVMLILGVIVMDAGVQAAHIACQVDVFSIYPEARARLNGIYMFLRFAGGALGSLMGAWSWNHWGWPGVCGAGLILCILSLISLNGHQEGSK